MAVMKIRNSIAYHYYQPKKLVQGYKKHSSSPRSEHNALAYSSFGKNMEESRFYFADAAAEHAVNTYRRMSTERFSKQLQKYVAAANEVSSGNGGRPGPSCSMIRPTRANEPDG